jgi:hypothetical protein
MAESAGESAGQVVESLRGRLEALGSIDDPGERSTLWFGVERAFTRLCVLAGEQGEAELEAIPGVPLPVAAYAPFAWLAHDVAQAEFLGPMGRGRWAMWARLEENDATRELLGEFATSVTGARAVEVFAELQEIVRAWV